MANRFKDLKWWQKLGVLGAIASILGCLVIFREYLWLALKWAWAGIGSVWSHLTDDSAIPFWLLYALLLLILILARKVAVSWLGGLRLPSGVLTPQHYYKDVFYGIVWRWRYPSKHYLRPEEFVPFCPICDLELQRTQFESHVIPVHLYCDNCRKLFTIESESVSGILDYMVREIPRRIRSGEWKERFSSGAAE